MTSSSEKSIYRVSSAGDCPRALGARRLGYEPTPETEVGIRAMSEGSRLEPVIISELEKEGYRIFDTQKELDWETPILILRGHIDGIAQKDPSREIPIPMTRILEIKTMGKNPFANYQKGGLTAFPSYQAQITCYSTVTDLPILYVVRNRDTGETIITEMDKPPIAYFDAIIDKLNMVELYALDNVLPEADKTDDNCRWCKFKYLCSSSISSPKPGKEEEKISPIDVEVGVGVGPLMGTNDTIDTTGLIVEVTAMVKKPHDDAEVMAFYGEALSLQGYAEKRVIVTVEDLIPATDDLTIIAKVKKGMEDKRKGFVVPLQDKVKEINDAFKTLMEPIEVANQINRDKMTAYDAEQNRIRKEQEEINRKRMEAAQAEMNLMGELTESVNLVEVIPEPSKQVSTELGSVSKRANWTYEVTDFGLMPDEYKVPDTTMLNSTAKKHHDKKEVPGVRFYNKPTLTVKTR